MSQSLALWRKLSNYLGGKWLYGRLICLKAPYFTTIAPRFERLEPGRCEIALRDRRRVHNHLGTVHAIALCNLAELSGGMLTDASIPPGMRWIPRGMQVAYLAKARGTMHAVATPEAPAVEASAGYAWPVQVSVRNDAGEEVFRARIDMWLSPRQST